MGRGRSRGLDRRDWRLSPKFTSRDSQRMFSLASAYNSPLGPAEKAVCRQAEEEIPHATAA